MARIPIQDDNDNAAAADDAADGVTAQASIETQQQSPPGAAAASGDLDKLRTERDDLCRTLARAPSISDDDAPTSERYTRWSEFVPALLDELEAIGYLPHSGQAWSHHNYTDVERRQTRTRSQAIRALLKGRWGGFVEGEAPTVFVTEGGARLSRMPDLYPGEEPRAAQARCLRDAWALHARPDGRGGRRGDVRPVPALRRPQLRFAACSTRSRARRTPGL